MRARIQPTAGISGLALDIRPQSSYVWAKTKNPGCLRGFKAMVAPSGIDPLT